MSIAEKIMEQIQGMPEMMQVEVLDFVKYFKTMTQQPTRDEKEWSDISLSFAMRDMEDEDSLYSLDDIKESL